MGELRHALTSDARHAVADYWSVVEFALMTVIVLTVE
jgi:hypothetical protein